MPKFLVAATLFSLPLLALYAFPFTVFVLSREFVPLTEVLDRQDAAPDQLLYLPAFADYNRPYKILGTTRRNPDVLVLGPSPALEFRSQFFSTTTKFYNAGSAVLRLEDLPSFIQDLPASVHPQALILTLAQNMLVSGDPGTLDTLDSKGTRASMLHYFFASRWKLVYAFYAEKKFSFSDLLRVRQTSANIGLAALTNYNLRGGFRADGSKAYGNLPLLRLAFDSSLVHYLEHISPGDGGQLYPAQIAPEKLSSLAEFLALCRARNISVIAYMPPLAPRLYAAFAHAYAQPDSGFNQDPKKLRAIFDAYGVPFYDLANPRTLGISDEEMLDPIHATEIGDIQVLQYLAAHEPVLLSHLNPDIFASQPQK